MDTSIRTIYVVDCDNIPDIDPNVNYSIVYSIDEPLPEKLMNLKNVTKFTCNYRGSALLPEGIGSLVKLETLIINNVSMVITGEVLKLKKLTYLQVNSMSKKFPSVIYHMKKIKTLIFSGMCAREINDGIKNLTNLQSLDISATEIPTIPDFILEMKSLRSLTLRRVLMKEIPDDINKLQNLNHLNLKDNLIESLPDSICDLPNLQILDLRNNNITRLPENFHKLSNLTTLDLDTNELSELPDNFGKLSNLKFLTLGYNSFSEFPPQFRTLRNLEVLFLRQNAIATLPNWIGELVRLHHLHISNNKITEIPREIGNCLHLQILECQYNQLRTLPFELGMIPNLIQVSYMNNGIRHVPPNVARLAVVNFERNVYTDSQSVHTSSIQDSVKESIIKIMSEKPKLDKRKTIKYIVSKLPERVSRIILEFCDDKEPHSLLRITFLEALISVVSIIKDHPHEDELLTVLSTEMLDSECKCFTGRLSRLVNVLSGFDERVNISISESEQIGAIISRLGEFEPYDPDVHRARAKKELEERGYEIEIIENWIAYIE